MTKVKQAVVRTYPKGWNITIGNLRDYLDQGYVVVMVNEFSTGKDKGLEYIVQKEIEDDTRFRKDS